MRAVEIRFSRRKLMRFWVLLYVKSMATTKGLNEMVYHEVRYHP